MKSQATSAKREGCLPHAGGDVTCTALPNCASAGPTDQLAAFVAQLAQFFSAKTLLQVDWTSDEVVEVTAFQSDGGATSKPQPVATGALNPQLPLAEGAVDTLFNLGSLNSVNDAILPGWLKELYRVTGRSLWVALEASPGHDRAWWETRFFEVGFRKHPLYQQVMPFETLENEGWQITLLLEKVPAAALLQYPLEVLKAERNLHMDMLRETGIRSDAHLARYILARQLLKPGMVVLDVACGLGYGAATMAAGTGVARILGMDLSKWAVEYARASYGAGLPQVEFRAGDATKLGFLTDASVDAVVSFETLEHLPNPDRLLSEFSRVLKPGGLFIGSVPNLWIDEQGRNPVPYHFHIYDHAQFREQIARHFDWQSLYSQNAGGGWKRPQGRLLRLIDNQQPTNADQQDAEWWIAVATKPAVANRPAEIVVGDTLSGESKLGTLGEVTHLVPRASINPATRIVVLDEAARHQELYGRAFEHLGIRPESGGDWTPEELLASKPDAILLSREWSRPWRLVVAAARRAGIPVIYVMDGVIEWSYVWNNLSFVKPEGTVLQPLLANHLCVVGQHPARILAGMGLADRTHVVGLPRLDNFSRTRMITSGQKPRILIATAKTFAHNVEHKTFVRRALRDLKNWFEANPFVLPVWRIAEDVADEIGVQPQGAGTFDEALAEASGTIAFSSTCLLESMLKGVPTAQLDYRAVPFYVQTAWDIRCAEHIPGVIQELLYPPPEKLSFQEQCLEDELEPGNASERLVQVICQAIAEARNPGPKKPLATADFGRLDFRQVHSQLSAFSASLHAPLQYELDAVQNLYDRVRQELRAARQELQTTRPIKAEADRLERLCQELTQTISDLDKICRERQQTIEQLDHLARERQCTIDNLDKQLREGPLPSVTAPGAPTASPSALPLTNIMTTETPTETSAPLAPSVCSDEELKALKATLKAQPEDVGSWVKLGLIFREMNQLAECHEVLQEALRLDPRNEEALIESGRTHLQQKRFWEARSCFDLLEEINPRQVQTILLTAQYEEDSGDLVAARLDYLRALKLDPGNALAQDRIVAFTHGTQNTNCQSVITTTNHPKPAALPGTQLETMNTTTLPRCQTFSLRSLKFEQNPHPRFFWHKWPNSDFVPPIYSFLHEDEWSVIESWFEESEKLSFIGESTIPFMSILQGLIMGNRLGRIVQLGTYSGYSSLLIGFMLRRMGIESRLLSADVDEITTEFARKYVHLAGLEDQVKLVLSDSKRPGLADEAVTHFKGLRPQLVIIDSSHQQEQTVVELDLWYDTLSPGGFLILHDSSAFAQKWDSTGKGGVKAAFEYWREQNPNIQCINIDCAASVDPASPHFVYQDGNGVGMIYKQKDR